MVCIYCGHETRVANSRHQKRNNRVWRRRSCASCGATFTSLEAVDLSGSVAVKSQRQPQAFQRDKLFISIFDSLKHRKTALRDATALTDTVIGKLHPHMKDAVLDKHVITQTTAQCLQRFDKVAATHYEAFHPLQDNQQLGDRD